MFCAACSGDAALHSASRHLQPAEPATVAPDAAGRVVALPHGTLPPGASLAVLPQTYAVDGTVQLTAATTREADGRLRIDIVAMDAAALRALDVRLDYDPLLWHAAGGSASGLLAEDEAAPPAAQLLQLTSEPRTGSLQHTQALAPLDVGSGFSGRGTLATLWLASGPARLASAQPPPELPRPQEFTYDPVRQQLRWAYNLAGDYDQNGETSGSDLVALARHFGQASPVGSGGKLSGFAFESVQAVADGDGNGEVGLGDLTVIARYIGARLDAFVLYSSAALGDYTAQRGSAAVGEGTLSGARPYLLYQVRMMAAPAPDVNLALERRQIAAGMGGFSDAQRAAGRCWFTLDYDNSAGEYLWLRSRRGNDCSPASDLAGRPVDAPRTGYPSDFRLTFDPASGEFAWYHFMMGDFDENGMVNLSDLNVVGQNLAAAGPFPFETRMFLIDLNGDQAINDRDIRPIGNDTTHAWITHYAMFRVDSAAQVPTTAGAVSGQPLTGGQGDIVRGATRKDRSVWVRTLDAYAPGWYFVRGVFEDGSYGTPSNAVQVQ